MKTRIIFALLLLSGMLGAQQRDSRVRDYITPTRIVWQGNPENITGAENLLTDGNGQSKLSNMPMCAMRSTKDIHPGLLLDFGRELQGGLQIVTGQFAPQAPVRIRVRFGESVSEAMSNIGEHGATNDHALRDFSVTLPWLGVLEVGNSGYRFARIDLIDDDRELLIEQVRAISTYRDLPYQGSFSCSDERLNQIWQTGAYTVHLNMQEYLWDGIKRDRLVWMGDLHPEIMTVGAVFGYNEVVDKSLDLIRDITPPDVWMHGISSYSLWWIIIQRDWYMHHGDLVYLKKQHEYLKKLLRHVFTYVDERGRERLDGNRFLDWPSSENPAAINAGLQSLMFMALKAGAYISQALDDKELERQCLEMIDRSILHGGNDQARHEFLQVDVAPDAPGSKQAAALMALAEIMGAGQANDQYLSVNGGHGFSTFYGYYMLRAMAMAGNHTGAMEVIKSYWGAMIDLGATTFWEDFDLKWLENAAPIDQPVPADKVDVHGNYGAYCYGGFRHSLCHGWASGPTAWLSEHVLGFKILEPGCTKMRIRPNLGNLEWAEGSFPTPKGVVKVRHERKSDGSVSTRIDAPVGVEIVTN